MPFIGEIRMFAGNFAPVGWALCSGQLMPISENETLFTLIGTMYGGDGEETFAVPNLAGRVPIHQGTGSAGGPYQMGETGGSSEVTLTTQQLPIHNHAMIGSTANGAQAQPNNAILASSVVIKPYANETADAPMAPNSLSPVGGSQPHTNLQPYLTINFIISLYGEFPNFS